MSWREARSLTTLLAQVNALHPGRRKGDDGEIGDLRHQHEKSEHNPDQFGIVRALDITHDPAHFDSYAFAETLRRAMDPRIKYVISNRRIFDGAGYGENSWKWRPYTRVGGDPHTGHVHISVVADSRADNTSPWALGVSPATPTAPAPTPSPTPRPATGGWDVSVNGLNFIRMFEGRALRAYQDSVGVWTIGYGITNMDKGVGFVVKRGATVTADWAETSLLQSLRNNYMPTVRRVLDPAKCAAPQGAFDAALSFHFNTGAVARASWPRYLMAHANPQAEANLKAYNRAGGRVLAGLTRRRAAEWQIASAGNYGHLTGPEAEDDGTGRATGHVGLLTSLPGRPQTGPGSVPPPGLDHPSAPAPGALRRGSKGDPVKVVQALLVANGYPIKVDGFFGPRTHMAVLTFQRTHPTLTADGIVGPATRAALVRGRDMKAKLVTVGKIAPVAPLVAASFEATHFSNAETLLILGLSLSALALVYLLWKYRLDAARVVNAVLGRAVP